MSSFQPSSRRFAVLVPLLVLVLLGVVLISLVTGSSKVGLSDIIQSLMAGDDGETAVDAIVWRIRLPRAVLAAAVGGTLSLGGLVFQARLRNPLAEP
jgi:iron complex transport system permease protein